MEKHRCKLCLKRFANGRAFGGHMRSHMMNLYVPPKSEQEQENQLSCDPQLGQDQAESASSFSSSEEEENEERELLCYGLRENPKKSVRLVDPEYGSEVLIQDRESETESSKNPTRRRSKRVRRSGVSDHRNQQHCQFHIQNPKPRSDSQTNKLESSEPEPVSSISDTTPDEDVAYCLIMLSRDNWMREKAEEEEEYETEEDSGELNKPVKARRVRGKYKCETCFRVFRSYQALGGHRASHKRARAVNNGCFPTREERSETDSRRNAVVNEEKIHECPVCYRVFASGQALGGHKRSHVIGSATATTTTCTIARSPLKSGETFIDLNLPAPMEDCDDEEEEEISQMELSNLSDAVFFHPIKQ